jgi:hypothetical protein
VSVRIFAGRVGGEHVLNPGSGRASAGTVERHLSNIYARLGVNGRAARAAAAVAAQRHS